MRRFPQAWAIPLALIVLVSEHVFPGHLTEFWVELPSVDPSMAPSGLRLVE